MFAIESLTQFVLSAARNVLTSGNIEAYLMVYYAVVLALTATTSSTLTETLVKTMTAILLVAASHFCLYKVVDAYNKLLPPRKLDFIGDLPAENAGQEVLSQKRQVEMLREIISQQQSGTSITVGIDGKWGDGKSSIVSTAKNHLKHRHDLIWVEFESWRYPTEKDLILGFYDQIGKSIGESIPSLRSERKLLLDFAKSIVKLAEPNKAIPELFGLLKSEKFDEMASLAKKLNRYGKRIVLVIDDLDRLLEQGLVYRSLQLSYVFKTSDIKGTIVVIPADFTVLTKVLKLEQDSVYLQKISEINLTVAAPRIDEIIEFMNKYIEEIDLRPYTYRMVRNFRGAVRIINNYRLLLDRLEGLVQKRDIFMLCVLSYAAPGVYMDIRDHPNMYVDMDSERDFSWSFLDESEKDEFRSKHIRRVLASNESDIMERDLIELLNDTFYVAKNALREKGTGASSGSYAALDSQMSVALAFYLQTFFSHSDAAIQNSLSRTTMEAFVATYQQTATAERTTFAIEFFKDTDYRNTALQLNDLAKFQLQWDDEFDTHLAHDILAVYLDKMRFIYRDQDDTMATILGSIDRRITEPEQASLVLDGLDNHVSHPSAALRLLLYINPNRKNQLYHLKKYSNYAKLRRKILLKIDKHYLEDKHNVFDEDTTTEGEWRFIIYQWGMSVSGDDKTQIVKTRRTKVESYVTTLLKADDKLLHDLVMHTYFRENIHSTSDKKTFIFNEDGPYNLDAIKRLADQAIKNVNTPLNAEESERLKAFVESYQLHKTQLRKK